MMEIGAAGSQPWLDSMRWGLSIAVPAAAGLIGVVIGALLTGKRDRDQRRLDFIAKQLQDLYSPLLGLRNEIRSRSEFRVRVSAAADSAWRELCAARSDMGGQALRELTEERSAEFDKIISYNNRQLIDRLLPAYRKMLAIFRDNLWLAEPETRIHFGRLLEFIDTWDRSIEDALPGEVLERLGHDEKLLEPFYKNIEETHDSLRGRVERGSIVNKRSNASQVRQVLDNCKQEFDNEKNSGALRLLKFLNEQVVQEQHIFWQRFYSFATLHAAALVLWSTELIEREVVAAVGGILGIVWLYTQWASLHYVNRPKPLYHLLLDDLKIDWSVGIKGWFASWLGESRWASSTNAGLATVVIVLILWIVLFSFGLG